MKAASRVYVVPVALLSWAVFGAVSFVLNFICAILLLLPHSQRRGAAVRRTIQWLFGAWCRWLHAMRIIYVSWKGFTPEALAGPAVYIANHPGLLDATFILARLSDTICIFKPSVMRNPALGPAAIVAGYASGDAGVDVIRDVAARVAAGRSLLIFPEGTRTLPHVQLNPLKAGFALIAARAGVPVRLIVVRAPRDLVPKGQPWWRPPVFPAAVEIELVGTLDPTGTATAKELTARATATTLGGTGRAMTPSSATHLVLIPSYNAGPQLVATVRAALEQWRPVWVVIDGSTDGSAAAVQQLAAQDPGVRVIVRPVNGGKGAAVATGAAAALAAGFTHVLTMDSDGQHPAGHIAEFMAESQAHPDALVLGRPVFGPEAPLARLQGRKLSIWLARMEILGAGIDDPLFGFRVYPAAALGRALASTRRARGFDFDPEVAVRLVWAGVPTVNRAAPCRYLDKSAGGVSHFHYLRDNLKLVWLHTRLLTQLLLWRWVPVLRRRRP